MNNILEYLKRNHSYPAMGKGGEVNLAIMDEDIRKNQIFLAGENHGIKRNTQLKMGILKYFKRKTGFKYLVSELPASVVYFINNYLNSGEIRILKDIYKGLKGTDAWNREEYEFWTQLYGFNKKLPKRERIIAIGIDIEHQVENAFKFMKHSLRNQKLPDNILEWIAAIEKEKQLDRELRIEEFYLKVKDELERNETIYKKELGRKYFLLAHINDNILNKREVYGSNNFDGVRDRKIYNNFLNLALGKEEEKFFGQIGLSHVFQKSFPSIDWFGRALNAEGSPFKGKVLSLAYAYKDCKYLYPTKRRDYIGKIDTMDRSLKEFNSFLDKDLSLFRLNGEGSPFKEKLIWPLKHKIPNGGVTSDYFQYLLVVNGSEAMESLKL